MTDDQLLRYARHLMLSGWGVACQERVLGGHVLVIGAGGLGSAALLYLASAGVGHITVVDDDVVELSNLQRQIAHTTARIGQPKVHSMQQALQAINPDVTVATHQARATADNLTQWVADATVVLDCSDNFATRQAINAACVRAAKPLVWASALGMSGQLAVYDPTEAHSPCYACVFPPMTAPPEVACATLGVWAPLVGIMGSAQAGEALKLLGGVASGASDRLLMFDAQHMQWQALRTTPAQACTVCGAAIS
ncbi:MAG: HesA/MoeB/ThiF family protein [Burkholderiales bacterium]